MMKRYLYTGPISDDLRPGIEVELDDAAPRTACLLASGLLTPVATTADAGAEPTSAPVVDATAPEQATKADEPPKTVRAPKSRPAVPPSRSPKKRS